MSRKKRVLPPPPRKDGARKVIFEEKTKDEGEQGIQNIPQRITTVDADYYAKNREIGQQRKEEVSKSAPVPFDPPVAVKEFREKGSGDFQHIPRDLAILAADKAKRTSSFEAPRKSVPAPPTFHEKNDERTDYPPAKKEIPTPPSAITIPLPKPSSLKLPTRPKFVENELDGGIETAQGTTRGETGQQVLPSLPDISKFSEHTIHKKRRRMIAESGNIDYSQILQQEKQPVDNQLIKEVKNIFQKGIKESLVSVDRSEIDYVAHDREAEKKRYLRMKEDYEAAGQKFLEINLYVNAAHSYSLALVSQFIADGLSSALWLLEEYVKILPLIIIENEIFQVIKGLLTAVKIRDRNQILIAEDILQKVSFLSIEDKELTRKCMRVIKDRKFY
ncbi:MAG: hypothetical protein ACTSRU_05985 [Candidatus Hodarchaeales archaeon]